MNLPETYTLLLELILFYGPKLLGALIVWFVGSWIIRMLGKGFNKLLNRQKVEQSLRPFLSRLVTVLLKILLLISVLGMLGVEMTSFIALLGAAGLAIGMALSGTLQNFAGGVMLLFFKPFKIGDFIEAQGYQGFVREIQLFHTVLKTFDNTTIIIANGALSNASLSNYSTEPLRRVDWTFGVSYEADVLLARKTIAAICDADQRILKEPDLYIAIAELADSAVNLTVRAWVKREDYWEVFFDMNTAVFDRFNAKGIGIPYPQLDLHFHKK